MADWQRTLELHADCNAALDGTITMRALAGIIAERLAELEPFEAEFAGLNDKREDLVADFRTLADGPALSRDEIDEAMARLYDWGDTAMDGDWPGKKACWVNTAFPAAKEPGHG